MKEVQPMISNILGPGTQFIVTDKLKDSIASPGSSGFVVGRYRIDEVFQNLARIKTIFIRRGKTGKPRLLDLEISVPVFYMENEKFQKLLPEEGQRRHYVHIEREKEDVFNVMDFVDLEFLGYAVAMAKYIYSMKNECKHSKWPEAKSDPLNVMLNAPKHFEDNEDEYLEKYGDVEFRKNFMSAARKMATSLIRMQIQTDISRAEVELNAADFLLFTNSGEFLEDKKKENEFKFMEDNKILEKTLENYKAIRNTLVALKTGKSKSNS